MRKALGNWTHIARRRCTRTWLCILALVAAAPALSAQETDDGQKPSDEDEWYDPTDWFDGANDEWEDSYEWHDEGRADHYGRHYEWDPYEREWERDYGWYDERYDFDGYAYGYYDWDDEFDYGYDNDMYDSGAYRSRHDDRDRYGWDYVWDPYDREWDREYRWHGDEYLRDYSSARQDRQRRDEKTEAVFGRIDRVRRVTSRDGDRLLVLMRLESGRSRVVDLGRELELAELGLEEGKLVMVRGESTTSRGRAVFRADSIRVAGEPFQIRRGSETAEGNSRERSRERDGNDGMVTFESRLEGFKEVDVGDRDDHLMLRLRMEDGSHRVVDLGKQARLGDLQLEKGDHIVMRGHKRNLGGRQILEARSFEVNDRRVLTDESSAKSGEKPRRTITGQLEEVRRARLDGAPDDSLVMRLQLKAGAVHYVDLGEEIDADELDLDSGSKVRISGLECERAGRTVIDATALYVDGKQIALDSDAESDDSERNRSYQHDAKKL